MNGYAFYHEMSLDSVMLNWWVVVFFVTVGVMVWIGVKQFRSERIGGKFRIKRVYDNRIYKLVTATSSVIFGILFIAESWRGVIQLLDHSMSANDSPAWSIILSPFVILLIVALYAAFIYYVGRFAGLVKLGSLIEQKQSKKRKGI